MKIVYIIFLSLLLLSCNKDKDTDYNPSLGEWIVYPETLYDPLPGFRDEEEDFSFDISSLMINNIDKLEPIHQDHETYLNSNFILTNSQDLLEVSVESLPDRAYKLVQKTCEVDFTKITTLTLSLHCENLEPENRIEDNEISVIVRLCSDTSILNNFYEIERPVLISPSLSSQLSEQWPNENYINKKIADLESLANRRNELLDDPDFDETNIYSETNNGLIQKINGNPDLSNISRICVGIKNPGDYQTIGNNDGSNKSIKIWVY